MRACAEQEHEPIDLEPAPGRASATSPPNVFMVRSKRAAALCGISTASWARLDASGRTPAAVRLGGAKLYRLDELRAWCAHGCPPRKEWGALWERLRQPQGGTH